MRTRLLAAETASPIHALLTQISQMVACNGFHLIEERLICWLLVMHDRMLTDKFRITQEFLSKMLGVRRKSSTTKLNCIQSRLRFNH